MVDPAALNCDDVVASVGVSLAALKRLNPNIKLTVVYTDTAPFTEVVKMAALPEAPDVVWLTSGNFDPTLPEGFTYQKYNKTHIYLMPAVKRMGVMKITTDGAKVVSIANEEVRLSM